MKKAPPCRDEVTYPSEGAALRKAQRCGLPHVEHGAARTDYGWVGVVYLRPDQHWMAKLVYECGCRPEQRGK